MGAEVVVTGANFRQEVIDSDIPVIVDFWAEWCVPCKMVEPILKQIAEEYEGKVKVGKVNVDEEGDLAAQHKVASIPTILLFKAGEVVTTLSQEGIKSSIVGELTEPERGMVLVEGGNEKKLEHPIVDPFWRAFYNALEKYKS